MMRRCMSDGTAPFRAALTHDMLFSAALDFKANAVRRMGTAAIHTSGLLREQFGLHATGNDRAPMTMRHNLHYPSRRASNATLNNAASLSGAFTSDSAAFALDDATLDAAAHGIFETKKSDFALRPAWLPPPLPTTAQVDTLVETFRALCFAELFANAAKPEIDPVEPSAPASSTTADATADASSSTSSPTGATLDRAILKSQIRRVAVAAASIVQPALVHEALEAAASVGDSVDDDHRVPPLHSNYRSLGRDTAMKLADDRTRNSILPAFVEQLPAIVRQINEDVAATLRQDVATSSRLEVILGYPGINVLVHHRLSHALLHAGAPIVASRLISERAHSLTGIDIHPGVSIGEGCFIDHGTGLVIGGTAELGKGVCLFHGVTLGARGFPVDAEGRRIKGMKRHPILQDGVCVYAGATILGRITIGAGSSVGAGATVVKDVEPGVIVSAPRAPPTSTPTAK